MGYLRNQHLDIEKDSRSKALFPLTVATALFDVESTILASLHSVKLTYSLKKRLEDYFPFEKAYLQGLF